MSKSSRIVIWFSAGVTSVIEACERERAAWQRWVVENRVAEATAMYAFISLRVALYNLVIAVAESLLEYLDGSA